MVPKLIYGTANFGMGVDTAENAREMLATALEHGINRLDTGARYPPPNPGGSESLLGELGAAGQGFRIDTKILAGRTPDGSGELSKDNIEESLTGSLSRLGVERVGVLYCHRPDPSTPIADQAKFLNEEHERGRFQMLGISNFKLQQVKDLLYVCDKHGYIKPSVYQGDYNLVTRGMEETLLPFLREHGIAFYAFRPMAAGFLTGALNHGNTEGTRFTNVVVGAQMTKLFDSAELKEAYATLEAAALKNGIEARGAALRWLFHHSSLGENDGIILGASKASQLSENCKEIAKGPLPNEVFETIEKLWDKLKATRGSIL